MEEFLDVFIWLLLEYKDKIGNISRADKEFLDELRDVWNIDKVNELFVSKILENMNKMS